MDQADKDKMLARLQLLNETFIKGKHISSKQELIWSFVIQVIAGKELSEKQKRLLGEFEYMADTEGRGWEYNRGKSYRERR